MTELADNVKTWAPILVPLLALLAGTGWIQYFLNRRREKQKQFRDLLEDFLIPFEGILKTTLTIFNKLRDDRELSNLEYHPGRLQKFFESLPDDDPRKQLWKYHIELLQKENSRAVGLINHFYGRIVLSEFKDACDKFKVHAQEWEVMWEALMGSGTVPASLDTSGTLYAPQFPEGLENALKAELVEVRRRAGH